MALSHSDLIKLRQIFGYPSLERPGVCQGFSVMLGQAVLVQGEETFFARLQLIEQYKDNFNQLKQDIACAKQKVINKKTLTEEEEKILEIPAFLDGVSLSLHPSKYRNIFNDKHVTQSNLEEIFPLIGSVKLENTETPVSIISSKNYAFDRQELRTYFTDLESNLKENDSITPIFLSNCNHSVFLNFYHKKQKWIYVDTNFLKLGAYYLELNNEELTKALFFSFSCSKSPYVIFNTTAVSNSAKPNDKLLFESLNSRHSMTQKHVLRHDKHGVGLLYMACLHGHVDEVKELLQQPGIDIDKACEMGVTPLLIACQEGHVDIVKGLLQQPGIDIDKACEMGITPLLIACQAGHVDIVKGLLQQSGIAINKASEIGITPLYIACQQGHVDIVKGLLQQPGIDINKGLATGVTPLLIACQQGHVDIVKKLFQQPGIDINKASETGITPLLNVCQNGHVDIVKGLLQQPGIDINKALETGDTPLYLACQNGHVDIVKELLQQPGIDINKRNKEGETPLFATQYNASEQKKAIISLYLNMKQMECYGNSLLIHDEHKGQSAITLANKLRQKADAFFENPPLKEGSKANGFNEFATEFRILLHSEDHLMKEHRTLWKPILANIFFALTGIGLLAIALKFSINALKTPEKFTWNDCLFFSKTNRQEKIEQIEESLALPGF